MQCTRNRVPFTAFHGNCCQIVHPFAVRLRLCDLRVAEQAPLQDDFKSVTDTNTLLQMFSHVAKRVKDLHEAGYVHRDLKPANVMYLTRAKCWTLIDFGCVARIGEHAKTALTLNYAPPEVIAAYRIKQSTVVACESMDAWSVGMLIYELLVLEPALDVMQGPERVLIHRYCVIFPT